MEEDQIVEDVEASPLSEAPKVVGLKAPLQCQLKTLWGNANEAENFTMFRTPHGISQSKKNLFEPSVISIGPFHRGQKHHRTLEEQNSLDLCLSREDNISLDLCLSAMKSLEMRTRRCYSETFDDLDSDTFVEMMLLDGCFLLEYFPKIMEGDWNSSFEVGWNSHFIDRDLILQENQIPFFIVDKLYELIGFNQDNRMIFVKCLVSNLLPIESKDFLIPNPPAETPDTIDSIIADPPAEISDSTDSDLDKIPDPPSEIHHLVHLCYHYLVPNPEKPVVLSSKSFGLTTMFSANRIKCFLHRFLSRVLKRRSPYSTSRSSSVPLPNSTGNLSVILLVAHYLAELYTEVNKYSESRWHRHRAKLIRDYFSSPWAIISLIAAIILLVLTLYNLSL